MGQEAARRSGGAERLRLQKDQEKLRDALKVLFDLLEEYAPPWYTKKHQEQAKAALGCL